MRSKNPYTIKKLASSLKKGDIGNEFRKKGKKREKREKKEKKPITTVGWKEIREVVFYLSGWVHFFKPPRSYLLLPLLPQRL